MSDDPRLIASVSEDDPRAEARRKFLKSASQVAVTTPAVALLLSAGTRSVRAGTFYTLCTGEPGEQDDATGAPGLCDGAAQDEPPGQDQLGSLLGDGPSAGNDN